MNISNEREAEAALEALSAWATEHRPGLRFMSRGGDYALIRKDAYTSTDGLADGLASASRGAMLGYLRSRGLDLDAEE